MDDPRLDRTLKLNKRDGRDTKISPQAAGPYYCHTLLVGKVSHACLIPRGMRNKALD